MLQLFVSLHLILFAPVSKYYFMTRELKHLMPFELITQRLKTTKVTALLQQKQFIIARPHSNVGA